jgi:hypothetical protein
MMLTMFQRLRRPHDRIVSNIQEIKNALSRLSARATVNVVVLSPQKIQFCEQEIRAAAIDGVEFTILFDIAEVLQSGATFDVAILCCHVQGEEEAALFKLRQHGLARLYGVWFWDNHHHHGVNLRVAALADVVFVSHWHERQYLNLPIALAGAHIPAYSNQWSAGAIARYYPAGLPAERRNALFGGFGRYAWAAERNRFIEAVSAACPEHHLTLGKLDAYFSISAAERLRAWVEHKVQLVVPINRDVSTRVFEALMTGQIPLVPDDVPDLDLVIDPHIQSALPILRYRAGDAESAKAGWQQGVALFDEDGAAGVRRRHEFARDRHSLAARLGAFAGFLRRPGPFKLVTNGQRQLWDRWR